MDRSKSLLPAWITVPAAILLLVGGCVLVLPSMSMSRPRMRQTQSLNNLRNIAIAGQAYAMAFEGKIPAGGSIDDTLPEWSWQTQLLPYLEQDALYLRVDFTRPWTSRENREFLSFDLRIFQSPNAPDRSPVDGYGVTHYAANSRVFRPRGGIHLDDVSKKDGTTSTIMMGEIGSAFPPWARPGNTRDPARGLGGGPDQFGNALGTPCAFMFLGGNGRHLSPDLSLRVLELLADPDNGVPGDDEF